MYHSLTCPGLQVLDPNGNEFTINNQPVYIWDTCNDCSTNPHIDIAGEW